MIKNFSVKNETSGRQMRSIGMRARNQGGGGIGVEDREIVELYWQRAEQALNETSRKYGGYLRRIAWNILQDDADAEECVNDAYLGAWNAIPPHRPDPLPVFLARITRHIALNRYAYRARPETGRRRRRPAGGDRGMSPRPSGGSALPGGEAAAAFNAFLEGLPQKKRVIFVRRYWYGDAVADIAKAFGKREGTVKSMLFRDETGLKAFLEKEEMAP